MTFLVINVDSALQSRKILLSLAQPATKYHTVLIHCPPLALVGWGGESESENGKTCGLRQQFHD